MKEVVACDFVRRLRGDLRYLAVIYPVALAVITRLFIFYSSSLVEHRKEPIIMTCEDSGRTTDLDLQSTPPTCYQVH